jgi:hypothetical protein
MLTEVFAEILTTDEALRSQPEELAPRRLFSV